MTAEDAPKIYVMSCPASRSNRLDEIGILLLGGLRAAGLQFTGRFVSRQQFARPGFCGQFGVLRAGTIGVETGGLAFHRLCGGRGLLDVMP